MMNKTEIKSTNKNRVYRLVYDAVKISKPEISQQLGISMPTTMQNVKLLQEDGLLQEGETLESTGGRKAIAVTCVKNARYSVGIDITKNHIRFVVINLKAEILGSIRISRAFENTSEYYSELGELFDKFISEHNIDREKILGVGFSVPGVMSDDRSILIHSHVLNVSGLQCSQLKRHLPYDALLTNDANAAGYAEMWSDKQSRHAIYLSLSNSVGGAIIMDKDLFHGDNQRAGEFGHMTLVKDGLSCYCGKKGCMDSYCSAQVLSQHTGDDLKLFFDKIEEGEQHLVKIWNQYLEWLATAVNNLSVAFDSKVILGGYLGVYLEKYLDDLKKLVMQRSTFFGNEDYIQVCKYKYDAAAVGAALLFVAPFIEAI